MSIVTQLYFQIVEEINYMFRLFSGWAIIWLRSEYTTMWTLRMGERDLVLQCFGRCVAIYTRCGIFDGYDFIHFISISIKSRNGDDATKDKEYHK
jgi:hypothetical protein